jgi:hypothetical protein
MPDSSMVDVPVQYFQSVIAIELGVTGALLFEIHFFDRSEDARRPAEHRPDPRLLIVLALVLAATLFGSLAAILHHSGKTAASAVAVGLAVSLLPILLKVLPPLGREAATNRRDPDFTFTVVGLVLYVVVVAGAIALLNF